MISMGWLCSELSIDGHGTYPDLIRRATAFIETQTGRYLGLPEDFTEYVIGDGGRNLWLRDLPYAADYDEPPVVLVTERCDPGDDGETLDADSHFLLRMQDREARLVRIGRSCWRRGWEYEVSYTRGWPVDEGPGDLRQLVISLCSLRINERGNEGIRSETIGQDYSYTRFQGSDLALVPGAEDTIAAWRRPVYA